MRKKRFTCPQSDGTIEFTYGDDNGYRVFALALSGAGYDCESRNIRLVGLSRLEFASLAIARALEIATANDDQFSATATAESTDRKAIATRQGRGNNQLLAVQLSGPFFAGCTPEFRIRGEAEADHLLATLKRHVPAVG